MGVAKYKTRDGKVFWRVDAWLTLPDGRVVRFRKRRIPTREQAQALEAKKKTEAFEGKFFDKKTISPMTIRDVWELYQPVTQAHNDTWREDEARALKLLEHLGGMQAARLTHHDVDRYRASRQTQKNRYDRLPSAATLDREVEVLRRMLNYAVKASKLAKNPIAGVRMLNPSNVRDVVLDEDAFDELWSHAAQHLQNILLVAFDTGMRKQEILKLKWSYVDLKGSAIRLPARDTKTERARVVPLTRRVVKMLEGLGSHDECPYVFVNPRRSKPYSCIYDAFQSACTKAGLVGIWFHDLRRSFVTRARRRGVPESVIMKITGHRTRSIFDRYNIVSEDDLHEAVGVLESDQDFGHVLDKVGKKAPDQKMGEG